MKNESVNCKEVMSHICDSLDEDLNSPKCIDIKTHLESCSSCQKYFKSMDSTVQFYKKYSVKLDDKGQDRLFTLLGLKEEDGD